MTQIPVMIFLTTEDGSRAIEMAEREFLTLADLLAAYPAVGENPLAQAEAVTYFALGDDFSVISDPAAFKSNYLDQLDREDPTAPFDESVVRLSDFGVPDFAEIKPPEQEEDTLVWFCRDAYTGLPYRSSANIDGLEAPQFTPLVLAAIPAHAG